MIDDPFLALLETRGELTDEDIDELESMYDAGTHITHVRNSDNTFMGADNMGASPFEQHLMHMV